MTPEAIIRNFYQAFQSRDGEHMASFYSAEIEFSDPVYPELRGDHAKAMWRMLCTKAADLKVNYQVVYCDEHSATVNWQAEYTFPSTGRKVANHVCAHITFKAGKISTHRDEFNFWRWSAQALGPAGLLLGWSPFLRRKVQTQAAAGLVAFLRNDSRI